MLSSLDLYKNKPSLWTIHIYINICVKMLWPPDAKIRLIGKDRDARKDWGQEGMRVTENEMVWWHHWFNGHELEQTLGDSERQGSLVCYSPRDCKESITAYPLNNNNNNHQLGRTNESSWNLWTPFSTCVWGTASSIGNTDPRPIYKLL